MKVFKEIGIGINAYSDAFIFIKKHRLWHFFIVPALFNLVAFIITSVLAWQFSGELLNFLREKIGLHDEVQMFWRIIQFILALMIRIVIILLYFKFYRYLILILFAPILAYISERVQQILYNEHKKITFSKFVKDAIRGMGIAIRNLLFEFGFTLIIFILGVIVTFLAPFVPLAIFLLESYFFGFAMIDYRNEYKEMNAKQSNDFIWSHKGLALSNGLIFNFLLLIPVFGVLFAPVLSLIAAALSVDKALYKPKI
jgi:CysZ protein